MRYNDYSNLFGGEEQISQSGLVNFTFIRQLISSNSYFYPSLGLKLP